MKITLLPVWILATTMAIFSCSKKNSDAAPPPPPGPEGFWRGNIGANASLNLYYAALVRSNGTVRIYQGAAGADSASASLKAEGTWKPLAGNTLEFSYSFPSSAAPVTATVQSNANFNNATGQWQSGMFSGGLALTK